jgi:hypothetical protein
VDKVQVIHLAEFTCGAGRHTRPAGWQKAGLVTLWKNAGLSTRHFF